jgi:hypothetical protein
MSAAGHRKRDSHTRVQRRRRPAQTLVLLDYPDENELVGKPIAAVGPPRLSERRGMRAVAVAAGVVVAMGSVIGGSVALESGGVAARAIRATAPDPLSIPQMPAMSPVRTGLASIGPARRAHLPARPRPSASATVVSQPAAAQPSTTAAAPDLAVTYVIDNSWPNGFQGEVRVTNNTNQAISGWQIDVAVPQDRFNTWWNATGQVSNGVLVMSQPSWSGPLEPGQTLHAYFNATGWQTSPTVCAFNGITCATS